MPAAERQLSSPRRKSVPVALAAWLEGRRRAIAWLVLLGVVLASPSLGTGLVADDLLHQLLLRARPGIPGLTPKAFDLFHFANGDPGSAHQLMNHGVFPWWTDPEVVLAFLRPLTGVTHWLDHRLWPGSPALMHLHSLLWFGLLLAIVGRTYTKLLPARGTALLALLLFAIDDAHAPAVSWIANRNLTLSLVFALLALLAHHRVRQANGAGAPWLGPMLLGVGLLAGEAAITGAAYLLSYALFLDKGPLRSRLTSLVGYLVVILAWRVVYQRLGYGAVGSGVYIDPGAEPLVFARAALTRVPILLLGTFALPWSDLWEVYPLVLPGLRVVVFCLALVTCVGLAALFRPLLRQSPSARFWAAGCGLSLLPSAATFPHDRLLLGASIGAMALLSELFLETQHAVQRGRRLLVGAFVVVHLVLAPMLLPYRSANVAHLNVPLWKADASLSKWPELARQTLIIVNPPVAPFGSYLPIYREAALAPRPHRFLWLATGVSELRIRRVDTRTLSVRPALGYLSDPSQLMLRGLARPLKLGEKVNLDQATFEIVALTADGRPAEVRVRFTRELGDPQLVFLRWGTHGYVRFDLPEVGASVVLPRVDLLTALFG
jgi:hypothetical protein